MDVLRIAELQKLLDRLDRSARYSAVAAVATIVIAVVDLATGYLLDDRRLDIGLLATAALATSAMISSRRLGRKLRLADLPRRSSPALCARAAVSIAASLGMTGGIGYLVGGPVLAVTIPFATILVMAVSIGLGLRKRRRMMGDVRRHS